MKRLLSFVLAILGTPYALFSYELGIVTMFRNEANYLKEWVEYHHMLGVEHFLLYNDRSEDHWAEVLAPYISSGLVEVIDHHKPEDVPVFPGWQTDAYKDGLRRSKGNTKWLAFIDIDEFILPKKNRTIIECLNQHYSAASGVYVCWRNFGTNGVYINPGEPILLRLTASSELLHSRNASGKSIVRVDAVNIDQVWSPHHLMLKHGEQYYNGSGCPLYFEGHNLVVDLQHTSEYIQINHYPMRDEHFYHNVRYPRTQPSEKSLLTEHYTSFNQMQNQQMIDFIKKNHPSMFRTFWQGLWYGAKITF